MCPRDARVFCMFCGPSRPPCPANFENCIWVWHGSLVNTTLRDILQKQSLLVAFVIDALRIAANSRLNATFQYDQSTMIVPWGYDFRLILICLMLMLLFITISFCSSGHYFAYGGASGKLGHQARRRTKTGERQAQ